MTDTDGRGRPQRGCLALVAADAPPAEDATHDAEFIPELLRVARDDHTLHRQVLGESRIAQAPHDAAAFISSLAGTTAECITLPPDAWRGYEDGTAVAWLGEDAGEVWLVFRHAHKPRLEAYAPCRTGGIHGRVIKRPGDVISLIHETSACRPCTPAHL